MAKTASEVLGVPRDIDGRLSHAYIGELRSEAAKVCFPANLKVALDRLSARCETLLKGFDQEQLAFAEKCSKIEGYVAKFCDSLRDESAHSTVAECAGPLVAALQDLQASLLPQSSSFKSGVSGSLFGILQTGERDQALHLASQLRGELRRFHDQAIVSAFRAVQAADDLAEFAQDIALVSRGNLREDLGDLGEKLGAVLGCFKRVRSDPSVSSVGPLLAALTEVGQPIEAARKRISQASVDITHASPMELKLAISRAGGTYPRMADWDAPSEGVPGVEGSIQKMPALKAFDFYVKMLILQGTHGNSVQSKSPTDDDSWLKEFHSDDCEPIFRALDDRFKGISPKEILRLSGELLRSPTCTPRQAYVLESIIEARCQISVEAMSAMRALYQTASAQLEEKRLQRAIDTMRGDLAIAQDVALLGSIRADNKDALATLVARYIGNSIEVPLVNWLSEGGIIVPRYLVSPRDSDLATRGITSLGNHDLRDAISAEIEETKARLSALEPALARQSGEQLYKFLSDVGVQVDKLGDLGPHLSDLFDAGFFTGRGERQLTASLYDCLRRYQPDELKTPHLDEASGGLTDELPGENKQVEIPDSEGVWADLLVDDLTRFGLTHASSSSAVSRWGYETVEKVFRSIAEPLCRAADPASGLTFDVLGHPLVVQLVEDNFERLLDASEADRAAWVTDVSMALIYVSGQSQGYDKYDDHLRWLAKAEDMLRYLSYDGPQSGTKLREFNMELQKVLGKLVKRFPNLDQRPDVRDRLRPELLASLDRDIESGALQEEDADSTQDAAAVTLDFDQKLTGVLDTIEGRRIPEFANTDGEILQAFARVVAQGWSADAGHKGAGHRPAFRKDFVKKNADLNEFPKLFERVVRFGVSVGVFRADPGSEGQIIVTSTRDWKCSPELQALITELQLLRDK